ncbi:MAG TPA: hypothetical protein VLB12_03205 [Gemmatimonadales bacterium]|nr:hypothetical protein [Gemmatimonadales bacterium]
MKAAPLIVRVIDHEAPRLPTDRTLAILAPAQGIVVVLIQAVPSAEPRTAVDLALTLGVGLRPSPILLAVPFRVILAPAPGRLTIPLSRAGGTPVLTVGLTAPFIVTTAALPSACDGL